MKKHHLWLGAVFLVVLSVRLFFAFQTPYFSSDDAYFTLRQVEHITDHGIPLYEDPFSYSGNELVFSPGFYYILAFFDLFMPLTVVGKLIPNIFASMLIFIAYLIAYEITRKSSASIFAAFISGFIPVYFKETVNTISVYSLTVPLTFLMLYIFMKVEKEEKQYVYPFILLTFIFPFIHPSVLLLVLTLVFYIALAKTEDVRLKRSEVELTLFTVLLSLWMLFLLYKEAFLFHGPLLIWQNLPAALLSSYFRDFNILEAIYKIGVVPFVYGVITMYRYIFLEKKKKIYMLISFSVPVIILLWLKLMTLDTGLIFLGASFSVLYSQHFKSQRGYLKKTKIARMRNIFIVTMGITFFLTSVVPSVMYADQEISAVPKQDEIEALLWIKENTGEDSVVLAPVQEGHLVSYYAERRNVADSNFLLIEDASQTVKDIETMYTTAYLTEAVTLLTEYNVDFILVSPAAGRIFDIEELPYPRDRCFELVRNGNTRVYESICVMEEKQKDG
ncbi:hypothetical protein GF351_00425 [Candidatus Woesearchaeota archaeon]|nr:hypothetical protein [Candidatus Woesearchaeota archaeon]